MKHKFAKPIFKLWCKRVGRIIDNKDWNGKLTDGFDFSDAYTKNTFQNPIYSRLSFLIIYNDQQTQEDQKHDYEDKFDQFWLSAFSSNKTGLNVWKVHQW